METYSPSDIFLRFKDATWKNDKTGKVTLTGVYLHGSFETQDNCYLDNLLDENNGGTAITLVMPSSLRNTVNDGEVVQVSGFLDRFPQKKDCSIKLQIIVTDISTKARFSRLSEQQQAKYAIRAIKRPSDFKRADQLLGNLFESGHKPYVEIILASSSITDSDILEAMGDTACRYRLNIKRTNFHDTDGIIQAIMQACSAQADLIALARGGGQDLDLLDDPDLLEQVARCPVPLVTAIGHTEDRLFIDEIADSAFGTPSHLGSFLKETYLKATAYIRRTEQLQSAIQKLEIQQDQNLQNWKKTRKNLLIACGVLASLLALSVYLLLRS